MVQILLMLEALFSLGFRHIQDDFQHDLVRMTDEANLCGEQNKCVNLCIIEHYLFCIKNVKPSHFHDVIEVKEVFDSHSSENYFVV